MCPPHANKRYYNRRNGYDNPFSECPLTAARLLARQFPERFYFPLRLVVVPDCRIAFYSVHWEGPPL
jgi:hypothetical protein